MTTKMKEKRDKESVEERERERRERKTEREKVRERFIESVTRYRYGRRLVLSLQRTLLKKIFQGHGERKRENEKATVGHVKNSERE